MSAPDSVAGKLSLTALNAMDLHEALERCGGFFEHSPWIAERALAERPFSTVRDFHAACMRAVEAADEPTTVELIQSHPALVGRLAREGRPPAQPTREQAEPGPGVGLERDLGVGVDPESLAHAREDRGHGVRWEQGWRATAEIDGAEGGPVVRRRPEGLVERVGPPVDLGGL